jgi:hypothetical protein
MAYPLFTNNAATGLVAPISSSATTLTVNGGSGTLFPNPTGGNYFMITLISSGSGNMEIVQCTARSGDTFTIVRAQEGTTAQAFAIGDAVQLRITAGSLSAFSGALGNVSAVNASGAGISSTEVGTVVTIANTGVTSLAAGSGISLSGTTGAVTVTAPIPASIVTSNFSIDEASGKLYFYYGSTAIASMDSSGNFTALANVSGAGTP